MDRLKRIFPHLAMICICANSHMCQFMCQYLYGMFHWQICADEYFRGHSRIIREQRYAVRILKIIRPEAEAILVGIELFECFIDPYKRVVYE